MLLEDPAKMNGESSDAAISASSYHGYHSQRKMDGNFDYIFCVMFFFDTKTREDTNIDIS